MQQCEHTLEEERLCTGSQNCSLCRTGMAVLRHIFACVHDSDCMLGWLGPAFSAPAPALGRSTGLGTDLEHKVLTGHIADQVEGVVDDKPDRWDEVG